MEITYHWLLIAIGILLHFMYILKEDREHPPQDTPRKVQHFNIVIGILSERKHFAQREILRYGIQKQKHNLSIMLKFIVGKHPCTVPDEDRINILKCEPSSFLKPSSERFYFHSVFDVEADAEEHVPEGPIGYDFIVNHVITLRDLGLYDHNGDGFKGSLKVILYETPTKKTILSRTFLPFGETGSMVGLHVYKPGTIMILPKGFRGSIVVEGSTSKDPLVKTKNCIIDDGGGLITYIPGYRYGTEKGSFPDYINTNVRSLCSYLGPSFVYSSHIVSVDANATLLSIQRNKRYDDLRNEINTNNELLDAEQTEHNDLLFLDVVESYRNLPQKMLLFYEWLHYYKDFDYLLKTDDDCFVNMTGISHLLQQQQQQQQHVWIGNFRTNFLVNLYGKWEEHEYQSLTYPPFACGSGYILSKDIIQWIFMNRLHLKCYQGEDVSLGIWLSAIDITLINDHRFLCFGGHYYNVFSSPNNNLSNLGYLYRNKS